jgi:hypothetical protein
MMIGLVVVGAVVVVVVAYQYYQYRLTLVPRTEGWGRCDNSNQCKDPNLFCRVGDRRCLADADCNWANDVDKTKRDCTRIPRV